MDEADHITEPVEPWPIEVTRDDHSTPDDCVSTAPADAAVPFAYYPNWTDGG